MNSLKLDQAEKEILEAFEAGEFQSDITPARKKVIEASAKKNFEKDIEIKIKISSHDLTSLQKRALEEGLSSQAMISSVLHKFLSGTLYDLTANKGVKISA